MSHWEIITDLLAEATERPDTERRRWIEGSGYPDAVIDQALGLLDLWERDPHYLDIDQPVPAVLGPWRIGRELGAGGMGRVFEAFHTDPEIERRVALKVIGGRRFAPELLDLFVRERAILARLEHPNIVRLYDTGKTPGGMPYFAMEFVDGQRLDSFVQERQPSIPERVRLMVRVCAAVAFAHRNLIVHGDLKPGNILVGPDLEPRLLDFGIARILSEAEGGTAALTISRASPEQLSGQALTTESDVYQLGLLLDGILDSTDNELVQVIAKCLQEDPARRYSTAEALQNELQAWLEYRPLAAVDSSWLYSTSKAMRRHPWAAALVTAVLVGMVTTGWQARRASLNQERTLRQFEKTRAFSRAMLRSVGDLPVAARESVVESTAKLLSDFSELENQDPVLLLEMAHAWRALGAVQGLPTTANLGDYRAAAASYEKAILLAEQARQGNSKESLQALSAYYAEAGRVYAVQGNSAKTAALTAKLAAVVEKLREFGASADLATAYSELAFFLSRTDRSQAMAAYQRAVDSFERTKDSDRAQMAFALKRWGALLLAEKRLEEGAARYEAALAIERRIQADTVSISYTLSDLGLVARLRKRYGEALKLYQEALQIREAAHTADPKDTRMLTGLASTLTYMAWVHADAGKNREAVALARRALPYLELAAQAPSDTKFSRLKRAWGQVYLVKFLRREDGNGNAKEVTRLVAQIEGALRRDPDAELEAEYRELVKSKL